MFRNVAAVKALLTAADVFVDRARKKKEAGVFAEMAAAAWALKASWSFLISAGLDPHGARGKLIRQSLTSESLTFESVASEKLDSDLLEL